MKSPPAIERAVSVEDLRRIAQRRLPRPVFDFIDGGAEDEITLRENRAAFERMRLTPRLFNDVSEPDLSTMIAGRQSTAPLVIAPMGCCMLAWPKADLAIARAAAAAGIPYTMSTMSAVSIEQMADEVDADLWFQLYVLKDHAFNMKLLERSQAAGFRVLVVTADLQTGGRREKDLRNGLTVPLRPDMRQILGGVRHPRWAWQMLSAGMPQFENVRGYMGSSGAGLSIAAKVGQSLDASFGWDGLARLRDKWKGPLMVKGVLHPDDAERLVGLGVDGVWVSNHGGRQLDGATATMDALAEVVARLPATTTVLVDSGVRRGVDLLKARIRGATACAAGRAALYGAAAGGEAGARKALQMLVDELRIAMMLHGTRRLDGIESPVPA